MVSYPMKTYQPFGDPGNQPNLEVLKKKDAPQQGLRNNVNLGSTN